MNEFISVKEKLPESNNDFPLTGGWVLGRINDSRTNIKTVRYVGLPYNKWQNRDRSWCEEKITHWCHIETEEGHYEPECVDPEEYGFISKTKIIEVCDAVVALTLLKLMELTLKNGKPPEGRENDALKTFSIQMARSMVDGLFYNSNKEPATAPAAYLFVNGNAAYFDEKGKQIPTLQSNGWIAIHEFIRKYPNAPISIQQADPLPKDLVERFLKNIKHLEELPY